MIGWLKDLLKANALAAIAGESALLRAAGPWALGMTVLAGIVRWVGLARNANLRHRSTAKTATGIKGDKLTQKSIGMSAGAFNTREFFHGATQAAVSNIRVGFVVLLFALPVLLML